MTIRLFLPFFFLLSTLSSSAIDWPTYGGPDRNHRSKETSLRTDWGYNEPEVLWQHEVGLGYSSVIEV
ncbi:MAG: polyvinylalcohol dehydrogenase, partial [Opitutae bacterium]|nr:polyvinylalcohol dehydrogenase [Opitutae bacterium]